MNRIGSTRSGRPTMLAVALLTAAALAGCAGGHAAPPAADAPAASSSLAGASSSTTATATPSPTTPVGQPSSTATAKPAAARTAAAVATRIVVVRPVTAAGRPAPGYRVTDESAVGGFLPCDDVSPVSVSPNVRFCGSSAENTVACWKSSTPGYALCLRDPRSHTLARLRLSETFAPVAAPAHPAPQMVVLDNGHSCTVRDGGAWNGLLAHPTWVGWYYCPDGQNVYGPTTGDGVFRDTASWVVFTSAGDGGAATSANRARVYQHRVVTAYFVGTAA